MLVNIIELFRRKVPVCKARLKQIRYKFSQLQYHAVQYADIPYVAVWALAERTPSLVAPCTSWAMLMRMLMAAAAPSSEAQGASRAVSWPCKAHVRMI